MAKRLLLVEGTDDEHVVKHLCKRHDLEIVSSKNYRDGDDRPLAKEYGGIDQLLDQVLSVLKESDLERLAVVLDADEDAQSQWSRLRDRLRGAGYKETPDRPSPEGTVFSVPIDQRNVLLGVWIMPDNRLPGMLEDFLAFLVPEGDRTLPHVDRFLGGIRRRTVYFPKPPARRQEFIRTLRCKKSRESRSAWRYRFVFWMQNKKRPTRS